MAKLIKDKIQFIDTYLDNSDIIYADIRMEMVDHVASAIEIEMSNNPSLTFYETFKAYMVINKVNLINNNKIFIKNTDKKIVNEIGKTIIAIKGIVVFLIATFSVLCLLNNYGFAALKTMLFSLPMLIIIFLGIMYFILSKVYKYDRFSAVERMAYAFLFLFQIVNFFRIVTRTTVDTKSGIIVVSILFGLVTTIIYAFVKTAISLIISYNKEYKTLI